VIPDLDPRSREIAGRLHDVRNRIAAACVAAQRDPSGVTLIAVTKTFPAADARRLLTLNVRDLAENRDQEASGKAAELASDTPPANVRWHFVGRLQRNKARSVAGYAAVVHSVDRSELVKPLAAGARDAGRTIDVMIQVSLDGDQARGGALPAGVPALAETIASAGPLTLLGVMAVAPRHEDPETAFARLAETAAALRAVHPAATAISAGMSGDLETAIRNGATHVRIGTALLGGRAPMVR
jgi:pyridoxal phosphate enzyme (YggS family)